MATSGDTPTPWGHLVTVTLLLSLITVMPPSFTQILKGMLEGTSRILPALRVLSSLLSSCSDSVPLYSFCREAGLPGLLLSLLRHSQESNSIQQVSTTRGASDDFQEFLLLGFLFFELPSLFRPVAFHFLSSSFSLVDHELQTLMPSKARQMSVREVDDVGPCE